MEVHPPHPAAVGPVVRSVVLADGRVVTGYALEPAKPEPAATEPPVSRAAVNLAPARDHAGLRSNG
ncbi:hypothetical protein [Streptomyces sp. NPDC013187]|uniref:hypothetical protein n=1 Tax=Streptomyces sp. NPDC013187 TaxID=3364865 RepID=UPI0036C9A5A1